MRFTGQPIIGAYILLAGLNYAPLLAYAVAIVRAGTAKSEVAEDRATDRHYVRKYSTQQFLLFVPFAVLFLAILQELRESGRMRSQGI